MQANRAYLWFGLGGYVCAAMSLFTSYRLTSFDQTPHPVRYIEFASIYGWIALVTGYFAMSLIGIYRANSKRQLEGDGDRLDDLQNERIARLEARIADLTARLEEQNS